MVILMGCALVMAVAMPQAFSERAGLFVGAYVVMGLVRAGYMAVAFRGEVMGRNYAQLGIWSGISAIFWIAGVIFPEMRLVLWIIAVVIDYGAPRIDFWLPDQGGTPMETWTLKGLHLLERNQQVFIISLGESILLLGGLLTGHALQVSLTRSRRRLGIPSTCGQRRPDCLLQAGIPAIRRSENIFAME